MTFRYIQNGKIWEVVTINFYNQTITIRNGSDLLVEAFDDKRLMIEENEK